MRFLFIHGAGGYVDDRPLAESLGHALDVPVTMPHLRDGDMSFEAWATPIRGHLAEMAAEDLVVAHSFGASILVRVLAERTWAPRRAVLLGMPDWSPEGWDVEEYAFDGSEPTAALSLHHCRDDETVPFTHLALHSRRLPSAQVWEHATGGHQLDGLVEAIAADVLRSGPS